MVFRIISALFMSFVLSSLMTLGITLVHVGWASGLAARWAASFAWAWPSATVIAFVTGPRILALSQRCTTWLERRWMMHRAR